MKKLKDILLESLNEIEEIVGISPDVVGDVKDVSFSKKNNHIRIEFSTTYGKALDLIAKYTDFLSWSKAHKNENKKSLFHDFIVEFLSKSQEVKSHGMTEIVDDNGDIMGDDDKPNNATNTMVGSSVFDLEKVYRTTIPKSIRFYSGGMGLGAVTW
jgi:hypothetical protein